MMDLDLQTLERTYDEQVNLNIKLFDQLQKRKSSEKMKEYEQGVLSAQNMEMAISLWRKVLNDKTIRDVSRENKKVVKGFYLCAYIRPGGIGCSAWVHHKNSYCAKHKVLVKAESNISQ